MLLFAPLAIHSSTGTGWRAYAHRYKTHDRSEALRYHFKATRFDAMIVTATALAAIVVSVEFCIMVGVLLSFMFYVPKAARIEVSHLASVVAVRCASA